MSKFKVRLKVQGLELEIEGSREDVPVINQAIGSQIMGLLTPTNDIANNGIGAEDDGQETIDIAAKPAKEKRRTRSRKPALQARNGGEESRAIALKHDSDKWGVPKQKWNTATKAVWLLYVTEKEAGVKELTSGQIHLTFNTHFKQAGAIQLGNITRDLGKAKVQQPAPLVGEDTNKTPSTWYLMQAGIKRAEELVAEALGNSGDSN